MTTATTRIIDRSESQLEHRAPLAPVASEPITALSILDKAINSGMAPDALARLVDLSERMAVIAAKAAFGQAMAGFQSECPKIPKTHKADFATKAGFRMTYEWAPLDVIADHIRPLLAKYGFSYSWDRIDAPGKITAVCTVLHSGGHESKSSFTAMIEGTQAMSETQKVSSALKTAQRKSLELAFGLSTGNDSDDEITGGGPVETITDHEAANLEAAILDVGGTVTKFCQRMQVETLGQLPKSRLAEAHRLIAERREYNKTAANGGRS